MLTQNPVWHVDIWTLPIIEIMQKLLPVLLLSFVLTSVSGQNNGLVKDQFNYKIIYKLTYQPDSTDIESRKSEDMYLYIGNETSRFSSAGKAIGDSLKSNLDKSDFNPATLMLMRKQIPKTEFQYEIYKGVPAEKISHIKKIGSDKYSYTDNKNQFDWKVLEKADTIAGYRVQIATTSFAGRDYTAWFTQEIPLAEGPYKFNGLPGLIVKIQDHKGHYVFELTHIKKLENPVSLTFMQEEFVETTQEKLLKLEEEYKKDPIGYLQRSIPGLKIQYGENADQKKIERERKEKLKKENNPIELK